MEPYVVVIAISLILFQLACWLSPKRSGLVFWSMSIIAILPTSILAGIRDFTIGTDINHYVVTNFAQALSFDNFFEFNNYILQIQSDFVGLPNNTESGYNLLVFLVSRFTQDAHWVLFFLEFLTLLFVILAAVKFSGFLEISPVLVLAGQYGVHYLSSFNIMRQELAVSILLLAMGYLIAGQYKRYLIFQIIASFIHQSALMGIIVAIIWIWARRRKLHFSSTMAFPLGILAILVTAFAGRYLFMGIHYVAANVSFLSGFQHSFDITTAYTFSGILVFLVPETFALLAVFIRNILVSEVEDGESQKIEHGLIVMSIFSLCFNTIYLYQNVIPRLALYFSIFTLILWPLLIKRSKGVAKFTSSFLFVIAMCFVFWRLYATNNGQIAPYSSQILSQFIFNFK